MVLQEAAVVVWFYQKSSWIGFVLILRVNQKILSMWKIKKWNLPRRIRIRIQLGNLDPKKDSEKEDSGILGTSGDFAAPTVDKPEFKGGVPFTESPILEIPEYMGVLSTSGEESVPTVEQHDFTGGVNGGDSLVTEVPEYSGVLSTLGDFPAPTIDKPDFRGGINGADADVHHLFRLYRRSSFH